MISSSERVTFEMVVDLGGSLGSIFMLRRLKAGMFSISSRFAHLLLLAPANGDACGAAGLGEVG